MRRWFGRRSPARIDFDRESPDPQERLRHAPVWNRGALVSVQSDVNPLVDRFPARRRSATRPRQIADFAISRLRASPVLRACALIAFLEYGALAFLAVFGARMRPDFWVGGANFQLAGWLAICSLGSWFSIFAWFPYLETLQSKESGDGAALRMGRTLEVLAIGCVVFVHGMLAWTLALAVT